ncbi:THAP domain-containing protein 6-like [Aulostomus maculatus]
MPEHCVTCSCSNRSTVENKAKGITFHKFPKDKTVRKKRVVALRRERFTANDSSMLCSEPFKDVCEGDFDRTGQIDRLRDGVISSICNFPVHLQIRQRGRTMSTSRRAEESLTMAFQDAPEADHYNALPASLTALKIRFNEALARVESLEQERENAMAKEKRAKTTVKSLLGDLREKKLINEELKERREILLSETSNVAAQDGTVSLSAVEMSSAEEQPPPFANIPAVVSDHGYLPTPFGLVENALVYIAGFVVQQILRELTS